jgi:hypothetical protein
MTQNSHEATIGLSGTTATALWTGRVMTGLFVLFMLFDVGIKLMRLPIVDDAMIQLGYPPGLGFAIGVLEAVLLALYLIPRIAILGAVLFTGVFGGAIASHMRIGDPKSGSWMIACVGRIGRTVGDGPIAAGAFASPYG